jgi:hypothetical protein
VKKRAFHNKASKAATGFVSLLLLTGIANADSNLSAKWSRSAVPAANQSYLVQTEYREKGLNDEVFLDPAAAHAMRIEAESHFDADEARARAGLYEASDEAGRFAVLKSYARRAMNSVTHLRMKIEGQRVKDAFMNTGMPKEPIAAAILVGTLYTGKSMRFKLFGDTAVDSRISLKDKNGSFSVPLASTGFVGTLAYDRANPACGPGHSCAGLSRELAPNVSAELNSADRGTGRLVYSVSF